MNENIQYETDQRIDSNGAVEGLAKTLVSFAAYGYGYSQLDTLFDGIINADVTGHMAAFKLPWSSKYSTQTAKEFGGTAIRFSTNLEESMNYNSSVSNIVRNLERGDRSIINYLKKNNIAHSDLESIVSGKTKNFSFMDWMRKKGDYNSSLVSEIAKLEKKGGENVYKDTAKLIAKKYGYKESAVKGLGESLKKISSEIKTSKLYQRRLDKGVGLLVDFGKILPKNKLGLGLFKFTAGSASILVHPYFLVASEALKAIKNLEEKEAKNNIEEYTSQIDEYDFADTSNEVNATRQMNMTNIATEKQLLDIGMQTGKNINKILNQALRSPVSNIEPNRYRRRHR